MIEYCLCLFLHFGLANDSFAVREATSQILDASPSLRIAIPRLLRSKDPEVVARARRIFAAHPRSTDGLLPEVLEIEVVGCTQPVLVCVRCGPPLGLGLTSTWIHYDERSVQAKHPDCIVICAEEFPGTFEEQRKYGGKSLLYLLREGEYRLVRVFEYNRVGTCDDGSVMKAVKEGK